MADFRKARTGRGGRGAAKLFSGENLTNLIGLVRSVGTLKAAQRILNAEDGTADGDVRAEHGFEEQMDVVYQTILRTVQDYNKDNPKDAVELVKGARQVYAKDEAGKPIWISAGEAVEKYGIELPEGVSEEDEYRVKVADLENEGTAKPKAKSRRGKKAA